MKSKPTPKSGNSRSTFPTPNGNEYIDEYSFQPSLSIGQHPIKRTAVYKYLDYHVDERLSFNEHCKKMLQKVQENSAILKYITRSKVSLTRARKIDSCLVSSTIGGMEPITMCDGYQTTRQQNQKHKASFIASSTRLQRFHLSFSKITF